MKRTEVCRGVSILAVLFLVLFGGTGRVLAHCDGLDGPVVMAAKHALEMGNVNLVLIWVQKEHEDEIKKAFQKTLSVRRLSPEARELAELYFFETLVRLHRAGEGEPYTGLKPAGRDLGPAIPAADKAITDGQLEPLYKLVAETLHDGLHEKFKTVMERRPFDKNNVRAGREYVEAYVILLHYVEGLYDAAKKGAHGHEHAEHEGHKH